MKSQLVASRRNKLLGGIANGSIEFTSACIIQLISNLGGRIVNKDDPREYFPQELKTDLDSILIVSYRLARIENAYLIRCIAQNRLLERKDMMGARNSMST